MITIIMGNLKKILFVVSLFWASVSGYSQSMNMYNHGILQVNPNGFMAVLSDFYNIETGTYENNGEVLFAGHFDNEGITSYDPQYQGYTRFEGALVQNISGSFPADFYDVLFKNSSTQPAFLLSGNIAINGNADFMKGIVKNDSGIIIFEQGATHSNTDNTSHVDGLVHKNGVEYFRYPVGNGGYYRFSEISANGNPNAVFSGKYRFENSNPLYPHTNKEETIQFINNTEYWELYKEGVSEDVLLTLSWNEITTAQEIINPADNIHIVRWSNAQNQWVSEGGVVDQISKTVTTIAQVGGYGVFTLAKTDSDIDDPELIDDVIIYNGVSPNDDGAHDYFIIENIQKYPDNRVMIFNRWGVKVFETKNYDTKGNVFKGYSEARATIGKGFLPTGTYYYVVEYSIHTREDSKRIKKAGHLYLKTD